MPKTINKVSCAVCRYPLRDVADEGEVIKCPYCGTINEAIGQVSIPTPLFTFMIGVGLGVLLGPALIASTQSGAEWLAKKARERIK